MALYIRLTRLRIFSRFKILCCTVAVVILFWLYATKPPPNTELQTIPMRIPEKKCVHPTLDPNHPSLAKYFHSIPPLKCKDEQNWVYVHNGTFHISSEMNKQHGNITCDIIPMVRVTDFKTDDGETIKDVKNGTKLTSDFFKADCKAGNKTYNNVHAGVAYQKDEGNREENLSLASMGMNVLVVGFDSISRMTAIRKLPKTRDYLLNKLQGFDLEDYNIIGDGTPAAMQPIMTGMREEELPEARRGHSGAEPVDRHPFIFKDFKKAGYVTFYAEDGPSMGTFHYRMLGFKDPPTDHYMRYFYVSADKTTNNYCYGSVPKHQYYLDWLRDAYLMYPNKLKFVFGFHCELSHADSNKLDYVDEDIANFFKYMETNGHLNNTFLIFMSDHGARFSANREAAQGKHEERMPMFTIRVPPFFQRKYPVAFRALKTNAHRLTTPYDIHETLKDILEFRGTGEGDISKRGISLFKEISKERTCKHADVDAHWCACLDWKPVASSDSALKKITSSIISFLNQLTEEHRHECTVLHFKTVMNAYVMKTNSRVLKFLKAKDADGRVGLFSANTKDSEVLYQVTIATEPGDGHFEVTARYIIDSDKIMFTAKDISRTNKYGSDPDCVAKDYPHLRRFCYCKNKLINSSAINGLARHGEITNNQ